MPEQSPGADQGGGVGEIGGLAVVNLEAKREIAITGLGEWVNKNWVNG